METAEEELRKVTSAQNRKELEEDLYKLHLNLSQQQITCPRCVEKGMNVVLLPFKASPEGMECLNCAFRFRFKISNIGVLNGD